MESEMKKSKLKFETPTLGNRIVVVENDALIEEMKTSRNELLEVIKEIKVKQDKKTGVKDETK
jgi:hypothetical protein